MLSRCSQGVEFPRRAARRIAAIIKPEFRFIHLQLIFYCALNWPQQDPGLFDHLVARASSVSGTVKAERLRYPQIDYELVLGRRLHRKLGRLLALEDAVDVAGGAAEVIDPIRPIGDPTGRHLGC